MLEAIGAFRVVRALGQGGSGTVYLGERVEFAQRVAIKVFDDQLGSELDGVEEAVLAGFDHPNIVRYLDGGRLGDGRRYLVMEFADGVAIDAFADERRLGLEARVGLLLQLLGAVEHAHGRLIVHNDLKPANVLVNTEGECKLLDFGAAGQVGVRESTAHTPEFASPEQRGGERITVASDVYSLGLIARLVLAGVPAAADAGEQASVAVGRLGAKVAAARGMTTTRLQTALRGDLDAVLRKALQREAELRYGSAEAFAGDLRNWVAGRAVSAGRPDRVGLAWKWAMRHKLLAGVSAALVLVVLGSSAGVVMTSVRAARERRVAQGRLLDLVRLTGTLDGELYGSLAKVPEAGPARDLLIAGAVKSLDGVAATDGGDPVMAVELAGQYVRVGRLEGAKGGGELEKARGLLRGVPRWSREYGVARGKLAELVPG